MSVRLSEQVGQSAGEEINRLLHAAHFEAVHDAAIIRVCRKSRVKGVSRPRQGIGIVPVHADIDIDPIDLVELADCVTVIVHHPIMTRHGGENVLFQINARRNNDTDHGDQQGGG